MNSPALLPHDNLIGRRLKLEMQKSGTTAAALAKRADVKTSFIYDVISGKSANPSTVKLARVAESLGISLSSLVGSQEKTASAADSYVAPPLIAVQINAAGTAVLATEPAEAAYTFRRSWITDQLHARPEVLRLMQVRGDAMEPTLCHNDTVLVDTSRKTPSPPGIFLLFDGVGLVIKRLEYSMQSQPPRIRAISDNAQYSAYERSAEEMFIVGRVIWFSRDI